MKGIQVRADLENCLVRQKCSRTKTSKVNSSVRSQVDNCFVVAVMFKN